MARSLAGEIIVGVLVAMTIAGCEPSPFEKAESESASVRSKALGQLATLDCEIPEVRAAAIRTITSHLTTDPDVWVRTSAALSLEDTDRRALPALFAKVRSDDEMGVRSAALATIGRLCTTEDIAALISLWAIDPTLDNKVLHMKVRNILAGIYDPDLASSKARAARMVEASFAPLIAALKHKNPRVRENAVQTLQEIGDPRAREKIRPLLKDPDELVRFRVREALKVLLAKRTR